MHPRNHGFTLIEILVVITIIAALAGMVMTLLPVVTAARYRAECGNNLMQIGGLLTARQAGDGLEYRSGAAFARPRGSWGGRGEDRGGERLTGCAAFADGVLPGAVMGPDTARQAAFRRIGETRFGSEAVRQ